MVMRVGAMTGAGEGIEFGAVVFRRQGDVAVVTVRGMTTITDVDLMVIDSDARARIAPVGLAERGPAREYQMEVEVDIVPGKRIEVRGGAFVEAVVASDLPEELPVVCTADPTTAGVPGEFLHRRGDRYVLMNAADAAAAPGFGRTTLVA
jgi:hypothetical protein